MSASNGQLFYDVCDCCEVVGDAVDDFDGFFVSQERLFLLRFNGPAPERQKHCFLDAAQDDFFGVWHWL